MSRVTTRRARALSGGALALAATLVAAPAYADGLAPSPSPTSTSSTAGATATTAPAAPSPGATTPAPGATSEPTGSPTAPPASGGPTTAPSGEPTAPATALPPPPVAASVSKAEGFVLGRLTEGTHVVGPYGPDLGQTSDVALALAATGQQPATLREVTAYLAGAGAGYVHGDPAQGEKDGANYAGPTAKLALVAQVTGGDPTSFGGLDLVSELQGLMTTTGPQAGRFSDDSAFGDYSNPLGQGFAVLALERGTAAGAPQQALDYLLSAQCDDGGFPEAFGGATCTSSPDSTGLVLQALLAADADCPAARALTWLRARQAADGSFGSNAVDPTKPESPNVNSTAYAALGLVAAGGGAPAEQAVAYLTSVQNDDGGLPTTPSSSTTSDVFATAQALSALTGTSLLSVGPGALAEGAPTCEAGGGAAPTTTPTGPAEPTAPTAPTATPSTPPTQVAPSVPPTATPSEPVATGSPAEPDASATILAGPGAGPGDGPVDDGAAAENGPAAGSADGGEQAVPVSATADELARTGTDVLTPVAAGVALVFVGLTLLFAGRRRGGRHA
jgi:hypothetical protein